MTEPEIVRTSEAELHRIPITALPDRYGIDRSNIYTRLHGLEAIGYNMTREKKCTDT